MKKKPIVAFLLLCFFGCTSTQYTTQKSLLTGKECCKICKRDRGRKSCGNKCIKKDTRCNDPYVGCACDSDEVANPPKARKTREKKEDRMGVEKTESRKPKQREKKDKTKEEP